MLRIHARESPARVACPARSRSNRSGRERPTVSDLPTGSARRAVVAALALGSIPLAIAVDTAYASLRGFSSPNAMPFVTAGLGLAFAAVVGVVLARRRGRAWLTAHARQCCLLVAATVLAWGGAEVVVGATLGTQLLFHHGPPGLKTTLHPREDLLRGVHGTSRLSFNSLGIRGGEMPDDRSVRRILCVGGSTTLCYYLDDSEAWPAVLEQRLQAAGHPCWVGNLGQNAYGTRHHVVFTRHSALLPQVDDVVLLVGFNDFMKALMGGPVGGGEGIRPLWLGSPLITAVQNAYQARRARNLFTVEDEVAGVYEARRHLRQSAKVVATLPDLSVHLAAYEGNLRAMVAHVRAAGARPILACNPAKWRTDDKDDDELWFGHTGGGAVLGVAALRAGIDRFAQATRALAAAAGVPYVDLSSLDGDDAVFFDDCHFTEEGARRVADAVAGVLATPLAKPVGR